MKPYTVVMVKYDKMLHQLVYVKAESPLLAHNIAQEQNPDYVVLWVLPGHNKPI